MAEEEQARSPQRIYANYIGARGGAFDLVLDVGFRAGEDPPEIMAQVIMSWEHLSVLLKVLQAQLDSYQEQVGDLPRLTREPEEAS